MPKYNDDEEDFTRPERVREEWPSNARTYQQGQFDYLDGKRMNRNGSPEYKDGYRDEEKFG